MVRAPCCEKMGLKKGPWTPEEDQLLIHYIQKYGHGNWRALPKQAGLFRCGKSCRLRWTNYLRPDVKRGNFSTEEENTIIQLHEMLGNRWSAIAAKLPGRTDNEIKNVWHTHLKKRLNTTTSTTPVTKKRSSGFHFPELKSEPEFISSGNVSGPDGIGSRPVSPQQCCSDISSATTTGYDHSNNAKSVKVESSEYLPEMDENFWSEVLLGDTSSSASGFSGAAGGSELQYQILPFSSPENYSVAPVQYGCSSSLYESMDFWSDLFKRAGESLELPEI